MRPFAAGIACLLLTIPWTARAQVEATHRSGVDADVGGARAAPDARVEELRRLEAQLLQLDARLDEARKASEPPRFGRRTVGLGLAAGGGVMGGVSLDPWNQSNRPAWAVGRLPSVELRGFLPNGMSVDASLPLGNILARLFGGWGFVFETDLFLNFDMPVSHGVRLLIGPGVGFSIGGYSVNTYGGYPTALSLGGEVRVEMQAGAEFLTAGGHLGIALTARPHVELQLGGAILPELTVSPVVAAGVLGLVGMNYYFLAR